MHTDERVARLESDVAHIRTHMSDIKLDIRELRGEMSAANELIYSLKSEVRALRVELGASKIK